jgi:hypothetical protein
MSEQERIEQLEKELQDLRRIQILEKEIQILKENQQEKKNNSSDAWYLLPFFFGIIGGLIAYAALHDKNKGSAAGCLIFGFIWTIIIALIGFFILSGI